FPKELKILASRMFILLKEQKEILVTGPRKEPELLARKRVYAYLSSHSLLRISSFRDSHTFNERMTSQLLEDKIFHLARRCIQLFASNQKEPKLKSEEELSKVFVFSILNHRYLKLIIRDSFTLRLAEGRESLWLPPVRVRVCPVQKLP